MAVNDPFRGGYVTRSHSAEMPWIQIELSRAPYLSNKDKRKVVLAALQHWTEPLRVISRWDVGSVPSPTQSSTETRDSGLDAGSVKETTGGIIGLGHDLALVSGD